MAEGEDIWIPIYEKELDKENSSLQKRLMSIQKALSAWDGNTDLRTSDGEKDKMYWKREYADKKPQSEPGRSSSPAYDRPETDWKREYADQKQQSEPVRSRSAAHEKQQSEPVRSRSSAYEKQQSEPVRSRSSAYEKQQSESVRSRSSAYEKQQSESVKSRSSAYEKQQSEPVRSRSFAYEKQQYEPVRSRSSAYEKQQYEPGRSRASAYEKQQSKPVRSSSSAYEKQQSEPVRSRSSAYEKQQYEPGRSSSSAYDRPETDWEREYADEKQQSEPGKSSSSAYDRPETDIDEQWKTKYRGQDEPYRLKKSYRSDSFFKRVTDVTPIKEEIRIVLLGRTGAGKSATGNSILNKRQFKSQPSGSSVTKKCQTGMVVRDGKTLLVVDTPGMFDTEMTEQKVKDEIKKCIYLTSPGPHAFILIVSIGRFTQEEQDTVDLLIRFFGEEILKYMIVLFTGRDDIEKQNRNISENVQECPDSFKKILDRCKHRFLSFNNNLKGVTGIEQVHDLLNLIEKILTENKSSFYTDEMYIMVERAIQQEILQKHHKYQLEQRRKTNELVRHMSKPFDEQLQESDLIIIHLEKDIVQQQKKSERLVSAKNELASEIQSLENKKRNYSRRSYYSDRCYNTSYYDTSYSCDNVKMQDEMKDKQRELEEEQNVLHELNKQLEKANTDRITIEQEWNEQYETEIVNEYEEEKHYYQLRNEVRNEIENEEGSFFSAIGGAITGAITGGLVGAVAGGGFLGPIGAVVGGIFGFFGGLFS